MRVVKHRNIALVIRRRNSYFRRRIAKEVEDLEKKERLRCQEVRGVKSTELEEAMIKMISKRYRVRSGIEAQDGDIKKAHWV